MVLCAAVLLALVFRLINSSDEKLEGPGREPAFSQPDLAAGESLLEVQAYIDRHQPDGELLFLMDQVQAPVHHDLEVQVTEVAVPDPTPSTSSAPSVHEPSSSKADPFKSVDIRYYVLSEDGLNFRESPSTSAPVKQKLDYGMALRVIGLSDDWARVRLAGEEIGYVAKAYISQYPPETTATSPPVSTTTKPPATSQATTTTQTPSQTKPPSSSNSGSPSLSPLKFIVTGGQNAMVRANLDLLKNNGLINKAGSPSINRHYASFSENGDGTITVDGMTFSYLDKYGSRYATHYDGLEVCAQQIRANGGRCRLGHTTATNHSTGSGVAAQRGIVAVGAQDIGIYPRGTVLFVRGYGMAVVGDRSGGNFDLCYDAGECRILTRSNSVSAIYVISRP
ncbi:MAG TPA: SH3 domain-containing protein [Clostridia bacterium]|nr:SH3 domain-containing protein [Clostridia bacterium]